MTKAEAFKKAAASSTGIVHNKSGSINGNSLNAHASVLAKDLIAAGEANSQKAWDAAVKFIRKVTAL